MATNKRKDAAALFELLDNSTLKVPKNAGSLKIPSWWSSKVNPSPERVDTDSEPEGGGVAVATAARRPVPMKFRPAVADAPIPVETRAAEEPHRRLFEPPPVTQAPAVAPSIRPPGAMPEEPLNAAAAPSEAAAPLAEAEDSVAPRDPRIFAPQMYAQKRKQWVTPKPGAFARLPSWVLPVGLGAIAFIICGTVILAHFYDKKAAGATPPSEHPTAADAARAAGAAAQKPSAIAAYAPVPVPASSHAAQAYGPGQVARTPEQYYIVIAQHPIKSVAEKNAQFLAAHGIDVSTEIDSRSGMYVIISVQGFPSVTAAKPYQARIIEIGHLTPEYKRTQKGGWDSPAVLNGLRMTGGQ